MIRELIPEYWLEPLLDKVPSAVLDDLDYFLQKEYQEHTIYPQLPNIFNAIEGLKPSDIKVVILGQDPYHEPGQAHGLSFSVPEKEPLPPSLKNIYKELYDDIGIQRNSGNLEDWKRQGVLLLNTVLTVRKHEANSHKEKGWEVITAAILETVLQDRNDKVFILWGTQAYNTFSAALKRTANNGYLTNIHMLRAAHPSPLSAYRGFFGSKPFSTANDILEQCNVAPISW